MASLAAATLPSASVAGEAALDRRTTESSETTPRQRGQPAEQRAHSAAAGRGASRRVSDAGDREQALGAEVRRPVAEPELLDERPELTST